MSEEPNDDVRDPNDPEKRAASSPRTVVDALSLLTGKVSRVHLREDDSQHAVSPIVDPAGGGDIRPGGRGNYKILGEIARGGMGVILRGHDTDLGRDVALKVLVGELAGKSHILQRFVEEAQIGGQLQHPGIVPVYEMGLMVDGRPYFTMKLVKGRTLSELLANRSSVNEDRRRFLAIFESVCQTVAYAHAKDVIHRDLKPANVMVGAFGEVQVVDWGLAKVLRRGGIEDERRARRDAQTFIETVRSGPGSAGSDSIVGSVMGTPAYMPPEQAMGDHERLDERADVFSLGAILCEILTGRPPYVSTEDDRTVVMAAHARLEPALERLEECDADGELKRLCVECLSMSPVARPRNAEEVARRIQAHLTEIEERARKAEIEIAEARIRAQAERRSKRLTFGLAATVIGALLVFGVGYRQVELQRMERSASTRQALDDVQAQVLALQGQGLFDQALEVARGASLLVDSAETENASLLERAESLEELAQARAHEERAQKETLLREIRFAERCEELRLQQINLLFEGALLEARLAELDRSFDAAFQEIGVDVSASDPALALTRLRESTVAEDAAFALDDWASLIRKIEGEDSFRAEALVWIAVDLDPDPLRRRLRESVIAGDYGGLMDLASSNQLDEFPAATVCRLYLEIYHSREIVTLPSVRARREPTLRAMIRRAARARPGDFMVNFLAGYALQGSSSVHYAMAARALRPESPYTNALAGDAFNAVGELPAAVEAYGRAAMLRPEFTIIHVLRAWFALQLGDYDQALEALQVRLQLPDPVNTELLIAATRFLQGTATRNTLEDVLDSRRWDGGHGAVAFALVTHPDVAQRDPDRALELMRFVGVDITSDIVAGVPTYAHLLRNDPDAALAALPAWSAWADDENLHTRVLIDYCRSHARHMRNETELADAAFSNAERGFRDLTASNPEAWQDSWLARHRDEVRTALGK